ncbi:unknown [Prevotella sp. CAG:487]|nr:unknown [Prevotella sp. CAG:487]
MLSKNRIYPRSADVLAWHIKKHPILRTDNKTTVRNVIWAR